MNLDLLRSILETVLGIGAIIFGIPYAWSQFKKGKRDDAKLLNDTLDQLLKARDTRINDLEKLTQDQGRKILALETQLHSLNIQKLDMEILIKTALKEHFAANPQMANDLGKSILAQSI